MSTYCLVLHQIINIVSLENLSLRFKFHNIMNCSITSYIPLYLMTYIFIFNYLSQVGHSRNSIVHEKDEGTVAMTDLLIDINIEYASSHFQIAINLISTSLYLYYICYKYFAKLILITACR